MDGTGVGTLQVQHKRKKKKSKATSRGSQSHASGIIQAATLPSQGMQHCHSDCVSSCVQCTLVQCSDIYQHKSTNHFSELLQERIQGLYLSVCCCCALLLRTQASGLTGVVHVPGQPRIHTPHPDLGQPSWCVCQRCREMPTNIERKCCSQFPDTCVSSLPHMELYILDEGVLRLSRRIWNDISAIQDLPDPGEGNKHFRYAACRQNVVLHYVALGNERRLVIPSCCVWKIWECYPDPHGQYIGYVHSRLQIFYLNSLFNFCSSIFYVLMYVFYLCLKR